MDDEKWWEVEAEDSFVAKPAKETRTSAIDTPTLPSVVAASDTNAVPRAAPEDFPPCSCAEALPCESTALSEATESISVAAGQVADGADTTRSPDVPSPDQARNIWRARNARVNAAQGNCIKRDSEGEGLRASMDAVTEVAEESFAAPLDSEHTTAVEGAASADAVEKEVAAEAHAVSPEEAGRSPHPTATREAVHREAASKAAHSEATAKEVSARAATIAIAAAEFFCTEGANVESVADEASHRMDVAAGKAVDLYLSEGSAFTVEKDDPTPSVNLYCAEGSASRRPESNENAHISAPANVQEAICHGAPGDVIALDEESAHIGISPETVCRAVKGDAEALLASDEICWEGEMPEEPRPTSDSLSVHWGNLLMGERPRHTSTVYACDKKDLAPVHTSTP